jgi:deazaflavin-dependent oxidoreductase (nitroreductase family)
VPTLRSVNDYNANIIEEFRANAGVTGAFGDTLLLVHSTGHRTGTEHVHPVRAVTIDGAWHIAGSAAGRAKDPVWAVNLRKHPATVVEAAEGTVEVSAQLLDGPAREEAWAAFTAAAPHFIDYQVKADEHGRTIPLFRLTRTS